MGDVMMSYGEVISLREKWSKLARNLDTLSLFVLAGLGVIYRASTRRTARQVLCGWQQKLT